MAKQPHWTELAWKFPFSTCKYLVLTVWERRRLKRATLVPDAMHTEKIQIINRKFSLRKIC